ncbi:MAG: helix-turn-helix domain-containing protein [Proteobacteria bacterium]|nr:helix-turn-helix domain-containing protein [Pseudomonadota bacterium]
MPTQSLQSLVGFVSQNPSAMAMFDRNMRYLAASPRWKTDYKLAQDPVGRSHYEVFPEITEDWKAVHKRGLAGETIRSELEEFKRRDGTAHWIEWVVSPWRGADGDVGGIVIASHQATAPSSQDADPPTKATAPADADPRAARRRALLDQLRVGNRVLADLPDEIYRAIRDDLSVVTLTSGQVLVDGLTPPSAVVFPLQGLCSVVQTLPDGSSIEVAKGGRSCHGGLSLMLDANEMEAETVVIIGGAALALPAERFRALLQNDPAAREPFQKVLAALVVAAESSAICAACHSAPRRIARWLLLASDYSGLTELPVNQETLAMLLGVRRTGVSEAISDMRRRGLIDTARGVIALRDLDGLTAAACDCWREDLSRRCQVQETAPAVSRFDKFLPVDELLSRHRGAA